MSNEQLNDAPIAWSGKWLVISAIIAVAVYGLCFVSGLEHAPSLVISITTLCTSLWISEAIPIPMTACIPMAIFPLLGVISRADLGNALGNPINFLLIGGFILSIAMVKTKAHLRICYGIFSILRPSSFRQLVITFMICASFLSMWISNAAATMLLIPIALATIQHQKPVAKQGVLLLLGIAYAASIGGIGTPIGTPPNLLFIQAYEVATGISISFIDWMAWGVPSMVLLMIIAMVWIARKLPNIQIAPFKPPTTHSAYNEDEKRVLVIFICVVVLWMTRSDPFGGWSEWLNLPNSHDGYIALMGAIALFAVPNGKPNSDRAPLLNWEDTKTLPWGIVLLVSGGISISLALKNTGVVTEFAEHLSILENWPVWVMLLIVCISVTFLTEVMSNTACTALLMPVLASVSIALNIEPLLLMLPAAITASCAFMMPMATAPNAIVFATQEVPINKMVNTGIGLNLISVFVVVMLAAFYFV